MLTPNNTPSVLHANNFVDRTGFVKISTFLQIYQQLQYVLTFCFPRLKRVLTCFSRLVGLFILLFYDNFCKRYHRARKGF